MRSRVRLFVATSTLVLACAAPEPEPQAQAPQPTPRDTLRDTMPTPPPQTTRDEVSKANLGERVTLVGRAIDRKGGATLVGEDFEVWMADFDSWPPGYYEGGDQGRLLTVTGTLAEDHGLPVFVAKDDEPIVQGIPVPEGTDLEAASHRWLLRDASWD